MENVGSDKELETWLTDVAGLSGKKLAACLKACDDAFFEDVNDLRKQHTVDGSLRDVLPVAIATLVEEALKKTIATESEKSTLTSPSIPPTSNQSTSQVRQASAVELPPDKFHYFCSHKVR